MTTLLPSRNPRRDCRATGLRRVVILGALAGVVLGPAAALAGPPYVTDDPEPVDHRHGEFYIASQVTHDKGGWAGTGPHVEVNYGVLPDVHVHLIAPLVFILPSGDSGSGRYGYGDTEVGVKYRFIQEGRWTPMAGTFPLFELPTGNERNGLGSGHLQTFLPLWLQKSFGPWTSYGGGGYWINPGDTNRNFWFFGWQVQRKITDSVTVGAEVFHTTPKAFRGTSETHLNVGLVVDFTDRHHLLLSAGPGLQGPTDFQGYLAYQFTFGPRKPEGEKERQH